MKIIEPKLDSIDPLVELFDLYRVFYGKKPDPQQARLFLTERIERQDSVIYLSLTDQNEGIGFIQLYPIFSSTRMCRHWLLNDLYVKKEYRGKGYSISLMEKAKQLAVQSRAAGLLLETEKTNVIGNKLYPQVGFSLDAEHNYYHWTNPEFRT